MNTQRRFLSCMMTIGALQSFIFCSSALDSVDLDLDDIVVNALPVGASAFLAPRSCTYEVSVPENIKIQQRASVNRKRYSIESHGAISQSVPVVGNRPRTKNVDIRGGVNVLEADQYSRDEK